MKSAKDLAKDQDLNYDYIKSQIDGLLFEYEKGKTSMIHLNYIQEKCDKIVNFCKEIGVK
jgi:hypothetical protein